MNQFLAILKDSYREAVDGWVISIMLALTALLLLFLASLSFQPAPADAVLPEFVKRLSVYVPDRGKAVPVAIDTETRYAVSDLTSTGGDVSFRLTASGESFRTAVATWMKPAGPSTKLRFTADEGPRKRLTDETALQPGLELMTGPTATPDEARAVSDDDMTAFVADQFRLHLGSTRARVQRLGDGPPEPEFAFAVTIPAATRAPGWPQDLALLFGAWRLGRHPLGSVVQFIEDNLVNGIGAWVTLLVGVVITASFIPNMLRKGSLELLVSKPIGRTRLLLFKYVGGQTFFFLLSLAAVGGTWLVLGLRSGHWNPLFLLVLPLLNLTFALLYAVSTLTAVFTRNATAAIVITIGFAILLGLIGLFKTVADVQRNTGGPGLGEWPGWVYTLADTLNDALPRYKDLDRVSSRLTAEGNYTPMEMKVQTAPFDAPSWSAVLGQTLAYIAGFLAVSVWRFHKQDS